MFGRRRSEGAGNGPDRAPRSRSSTDRHDRPAAPSRCRDACVGEDVLKALASRHPEWFDPVTAPPGPGLEQKIIGARRCFEQPEEQVFAVNECQPGVSESASCFHFRDPGRLEQPVTETGLSGFEVDASRFRDRLVPRTLLRKRPESGRTRSAGGRPPPRSSCPPSGSAASRTTSAASEGETATGLPSCDSAAVRIIRR